MKHILLLNILIYILSSCGNGLAKECEVIQVWKVQNYEIQKKQCPDMVLAHYFKYDISIHGKTNGITASRIDSCIFTWQADNESFLTLNVCNNLIKELKPHKILLDTKSIDSVTIFSNEFKQTQVLTAKQVETLVYDWNNSKTRGYSDKPFDSAFPAYQYKLTIFSNGIERPFYGYNYLILDSSNWQFEMSKTGKLSYFHSYWTK